MKLLNTERMKARCLYAVLLTALVFFPLIVFSHSLLLCSQGSLVEQALDAYRRHDYEKACANLEANLKRLPRDAVSHELLGVILDLQGQHGAARHHLEEALRLAPDNITYRTNLVTFYLKSNLIPEANEKIEPLVGSAPSADVYEMLGYIRLKQRQEGEAISDLRAALKLDPRRVESWYWLGFAYQSLGEFADAIASYGAVLRINPQHFRAHLQMGKIYLTQGRWSQAVDHLTSAARIRPDYPAVYRYLSEAQLSLGKAEMARSLAQRAVQLDPNGARAYYQLGLALVHLGRPKEAASEFAIVNKLRAASRQSFRNPESELFQYRAR